MKLYTDGSCLGNPGIGGWAAICVDDNNEQFFKVCGGDLHTTNNIMELTAVLRGLERYGKAPITVYTDSQYVKNGITQWIHGWKRNGWNTAAGSPVKNRELWEALDNNVSPSVNFEWVKAHNGDHWNEKVDDLARRTAQLIKES